jgi:DNA-binding response OmpR family regulator
MKHILLVEDEHDIAILLREAMESDGYYVTFVKRVADARAVLLRVKFHLLVANLLLPDGTAFDLLEMANQRGISAFLMTGSVEHMAQLEGDGEFYLAKPFRLATFMAEVQHRIGNADGGDGQEMPRAAK